MSKRLDEYRQKRDFEATPEPAGGPKEGEPGGRFVIQEHHARSMHWDLRLEQDGVLLSWALPRGIPPDPKRNHLAVHTEDHPLEYIEFEADIPRGEYGAGTMRIWDRGWYEAEKMNDDEVIVTLHGGRARGRYALFQTDGKNWMIHRMDPPEDPDREPMPSHIEPMLALLSKDLPRDEDNYAFEVKWDGVRSIAYVDGGRARFESRRGGDITSRYPELRELGRALGSTAAILDGEIVAFEGERPSFERLQRRMHVSNERAVRRLTSEVPVVYVIFDLLWLEGHSTLELPYRERRKLLDELGPHGPSWQTPAAHEGGGTALLDATKRLGLEGVVAKRLESVYEPGRRSRAWLKVKNHNSQEFVIGGWAPGKGARSTSLGSLLIGYYESTEPDARLKYAGRVGTGLSETELRRLVDLLEPLRRDTSPFSPAPRVKDAVFVEPELVAEVEFTEWTSAGAVRAPVYLGLRDDRDPRDVVREDVARAV
ncbi:MAG TPA: non-homologous end-joining DNA ligase [Acidimicrobiia bacterium]